jgi:hypothetical protein
VLLRFRVRSKTAHCYPFATQRLFFVYRGADRRVNLGRSVLLHAGQDVTVEVEGDPYACMAEALLRHLWMNATREKLRRVRMPQVVKPDAGNISALAKMRKNSYVRLLG